MAGQAGTVPVERVLERMFAPLHKRALGLAVGLTFGALVFLVTVFHVIVRPGTVPIGLLSQYFYGYQITWKGAFVGLWWAFVAGFAAGWFIAFLRNLALATWLILIRARSIFSQADDFLDHI